MAKTPKLKCPQCGHEHEPSHADIGTVLTVVRAERAAKVAKSAPASQPAPAPEKKSASYLIPDAEKFKSPFETPTVPKKRTRRAKPVARKK